MSQYYLKQNKKQTKVSFNEVVIYESVKVGMTCIVTMSNNMRRTSNASL